MVLSPSCGYIWVLSCNGLYATTMLLLWSWALCHILQVFKYDAVRFIGAGLRHIDGDSDMTAAVLVHIVCGLIAYALICAACAMTFHRWSMMLSLLCVAPLSLILSLVLCDGERFGKKFLQH